MSAETNASDAPVPPDVAPPGEADAGVPGVVNGIPDFVAGIDIGSDSAVVAQVSTRTLKSELMRNDLSNQKTPMIISFAGKQRTFGEIASQMKTVNKDCSVETLLGYLDHVHNSDPLSTIFEPLVGKFEMNSKGVHDYKVLYQGEEHTLRPEQLLAMMLAKLNTFASKDCDFDVPVSLVVPDSFTPVQRQAVRDAGRIGGINLQQLVTRSEAAAMDYGSKRSAETLGDSAVLIVDIGHQYSSVVAYQWEGKKGTKLAARSEFGVGGAAVDDLLFHALSKDCEKRFGSGVKRGTKGGIRLMGACRKLKESLSAVPEASATCESLFNDNDVRFTFKRDDLDALCKVMQDQIRQMVVDVLNECPGDVREKISKVELIGGGMRIPLVKEAISKALPETATLAYTMDSMAASAVGASLCCAKINQPTAGGIMRPVFDHLAIIDIQQDDPVERSEGSSLMSEEEIQAAIELEKQMVTIDKQAAELDDIRNQLEAKVYEMRSLASGSRRPHTDLIVKEDCLKILDSYEEWLYEDEDGKTVEIYKEKMNQLSTDLEEPCGKYYEAVEVERKKHEKEMEEAAAQAAAELEASGGKDDHDTRKLKKPERMRKVMMNKDEGTTLFKDGNFEAATLRYIRALQHTTKFFDLSPEDEKEVDALKLSLHLNMAQCYIKLSDWDKVVKSSEEALTIDTESTKALYRLAFAQENKKEFDAAKKNLLKADKITPGDKAVARLLTRVEAQIKREQAKRKKMAQKMFG
mmetsp:Transcript_36340/g.58242  ORF Transcript_36340/g.58242 Transcript_36340/m.58242 type:complete len:749 (-) Transcript_36340:2257-4503(-)